MRWPHVLVVDDDDRLRTLLGRLLVQSGFWVTEAANAAQAHQLRRYFAFDLAVVDVMMPGQDGLSLTHEWARAHEGLGEAEGGRDLPILLLTALGEAGDRVRGLQAGAEDYLVKPFEPEELVLRLKALHRRHQQAIQGAIPAPTSTTNTSDRSPALPAQVRFGQFTVDTATGMVRQDGQRLSLTAAEQALLQKLAASPNQTVSRDCLQPAGSSPLSRAVDVLVTRLRKRLEPDPSRPIYLQTVHGLGYRLQTEGTA
ncbi:MAG: response regulator transcription factor [Alphaproteobacteria bacterium]|nr:response regulator transcription factor [Alphaproteobacteria bacterium]